MIPRKCFTNLPKFGSSRKNESTVSLSTSPTKVGRPPKGQEFSYSSPPPPVIFQKRSSSCRPKVRYNQHVFLVLFFSLFRFCVFPMYMRLSLFPSLKGILHFSFLCFNKRLKKGKLRARYGALIIRRKMR